MDETRVSRYKEYRQSFIKEGSISLETTEDDRTIDIRTTTSTLPLDEVINAVQSGEKHEDDMKKAENKNRLKIILKVSIIVVVLAGLIVLGIFAFGR